MKHIWIFCAKELEITANNQKADHPHSLELYRSSRTASRNVRRKAHQKIGIAGSLQTMPKFFKV